MRVISYELVNKGEDVVVTFQDGTCGIFGVYNVSPLGIMCDDMETFIDFDEIERG